MENIFQTIHWKDFPVFLVGIKGSGMAALAEVLDALGASVTGSDVPEIFYTDEILKKRNISYYKGFSADNVSDDIRLVIHSSAYSISENPELILASQRDLPILNYTQALGMLSELFFSVGVAGVHGKTTTTAMCGVVAKEANLPVTTLVGSAVNNFDGHAVHFGGDKLFIAETCEYQRHFLDFHPSVIVLTSVEADHQDYYPTYKDIETAFIEYIRKLPQNGTLIYCADDPGAKSVAKKIATERNDLEFIPYGFSAKQGFKIVDHKVDNEKNLFQIDGVNKPFSLQLPGEHLVLDATAALAVYSVLAEKLGVQADWQRAEMALASFNSTRRRSEIILKSNDIIVIDDYAHHPTAIQMTLAGFRAFYPHRRIIVSFMSHTYSRTEALFSEFAESFGDADIVILHKIFSSAREKGGHITGKSLYNAVAKKLESVYYYDEVIEALPFLKETLKPGDLFITMGAGNNNQLAYKIADFLRSK